MFCGEKIDSCFFPNALALSEKQSRPGFELEFPISYLEMITVTLYALPLMLTMQRVLFELDTMRCVLDVHCTKKWFLSKFSKLVKYE